MAELEYDVVIVGGGPAGSTCALALKKSNARVLVIDKDKFPRGKVCGDALAPYIPKVLGKIDPIYQQAFHDFDQKFESNNCLVQSYNGKSAVVNLPETFYIATRYHFDDFLYRLASDLPNVTYLLDDLVQGIDVQEDQVLIRTKGGKEIKSKLVIGCDGTTSMVRRTLTNSTRKPDELWATVRAYFTQVKGVKQNRLEIYFSKDYPHGYLWFFPSFNGQVNVGYGTLSGVVSKEKLDLKKLIYEVIEKTPGLKERFSEAKLEGSVKGWGIPNGFGDTQLSGNRFMLCGDAASMPDPATGEGIGPAMVSGRIAGFQAVKCFEKNDYSAEALLEYNREIEKKYGKLLRSRKKIEKFYAKNNWSMNLFTSALSVSSKFSQISPKLIERLLS